MSAGDVHGQRHRPAPRWLVVALLALVAGALGSCSSDDDGKAGGNGKGSSTTGRPTTTAPPEYTPDYEEVDCSGAMFEGRVPAEKVTCGTLTVPEDRSDPDGRNVVLPVTTLQPNVAGGPQDPIVFLSGGPGDSAVDMTEGFVDRALAPDRPLIMVDQRGTGRSTPSLNCPEVEEQYWRNAEATDDIETEQKRDAGGERACIERLRGIADLDQYDTPTMAADVADLREAMGYDEWNLWGLSYGTAIGLEVLRAHPEGVRSAILDSVVPPDRRNGALVDATRVDAAFKRLFDACGDSEPCAAAHPDLRKNLLAIARRLDQEPHAVQFTDGEDVERTANLTGADLLSGAYQAMYDSSLIPLLPGFVSQLATGDEGVLDAVAPDLLGSAVDPAEGLQSVVECADRERPDETEDLDAISEAHPLAAGQFGDEMCDEWGAEPVEDAFHSVPRTRIPTLVLGNELDPTTPAAGSKAVSGDLGDASTYVEFPGLGHGALFQQVTLCPVEVSQDFIDDPEGDVDASCAADLPAPAWAT